MNFNLPPTYTHCYYLFSMKRYWLLLLLSVVMNILLLAEFLGLDGDQQCNKYVKIFVYFRGQGGQTVKAVHEFCWGL